MTALYIAHSRRRRKKLLLTLVAVVAIVILFRSYIEVAFNILIRGPFIARRRSDHLRISRERDGFDITFQSYPKLPSPTINSSFPVPPTMHHILLGKPKDDGRANLTKAREACHAMHPGYQFKFWTDQDAKEFVANEFPQLFDMWTSYRFTIQRADSLRYMVLYVHGGIFLDLDLECQRPLEPLRQFDFVAPEATPMGISNGFLMVAPQHPFLKFVIQNLPRYNVNWFGLPYAIVMFSTGCHFLSTMLSLFPDRDQLRILWGPNRMHQLSGAVTTPLFQHLGMSSWHSFDGQIVAMFKPGHALDVCDSRKWLRVLIILLTVGVLVSWVRARARRRRREDAVTFSWGRDMKETEV